jgi:hypothetical protein
MQDGYVEHVQGTPPSSQTSEKQQLCHLAACINLILFMMST